MSLNRSRAPWPFIRYLPTTAPTSPTAGFVYYDQAANRLKYYDGTSWKDVGFGVSGGGGGGLLDGLLYDAVVNGTNDQTTTPPQYANVRSALIAGKKRILLTGNIVETSGSAENVTAAYNTGDWVFIYLNGKWTINDKQFIINDGTKSLNFAIIGAAERSISYTFTTSSTANASGQVAVLRDDTGGFNSQVILSNLFVNDNSSSATTNPSVGYSLTSGFNIVDNVHFSFSPNPPTFALASMVIIGNNITIGNCPFMPFVIPFIVNNLFINSVATSVTAVQFDSSLFSMKGSLSNAFVSANVILDSIKVNNIACNNLTIEGRSFVSNIDCSGNLTIYGTSNTSVLVAGQVGGTLTDNGVNTQMFGIIAGGI